MERTTVMNLKWSVNAMDEQEIRQRYPTREDCLTLLEEIRWQNQPKCPYCGSTNTTRMHRERRYHCNGCNTSFSVTVGTVFHKSPLDLWKWFLAITILSRRRGHVSSRELAQTLDINKNTAWSMAGRLRRALGIGDKLVCGVLDHLEHPREIESRRGHSWN